MCARMYVHEIQGMDPHGIATYTQLGRAETLDLPGNRKLLANAGESQTSLGRETSDSVSLGGCIGRRYWRV